MELDTMPSETSITIAGNKYDFSEETTLDIINYGSQTHKECGSQLTTIQSEGYNLLVCSQCSEVFGHTENSPLSQVSECVRDFDSFIKSVETCDSTNDLVCGKLYHGTVDRISNSGNGIIPLKHGFVNIGPLDESAVDKTVAFKHVGRDWKGCFSTENRTENPASIADSADETRNRFNHHSDFTPGHTYKGTITHCDQEGNAQIALGPQTRVRLGKLKPSVLGDTVTFKYRNNRWGKCLSEEYTPENYAPPVVSVDDEENEFDQLSELTIGEVYRGAVTTIYRDGSALLKLGVRSKVRLGTLKRPALGELIDFKYIGEGWGKCLSEEYTPENYDPTIESVDNGEVIDKPSDLTPGHTYQGTVTHCDQEGNAQVKLGLGAHVTIGVLKESALGETVTFTYLDKEWGKCLSEEFVPEDYAVSPIESMDGEAMAFGRSSELTKGEIYRGKVTRFSLGGSAFIQLKPGEFVNLGNIKESALGETVKFKYLERQRGKCLICEYVPDDYRYGQNPGPKSKTRSTSKKEDPENKNKLLRGSM